MTDILHTARPADLQTHGRATTPPVEAWVCPRPRLLARIDESIAASRVTVLSAASGAGKTAAVASWVASRPVQLISWLDAARSGLPALPDLLLVQAYAVELGAARHHRQVVVVDNLPAGRDKVLDGLLRDILEATPPEIRFILLSERTPAIDLQRLGLAGRTVPLTAEDLRLDDTEIADVLGWHGVASDQETVQAVQRHTAGGACGVRLAAYHLQHAGSIAAALTETDRAVAAQLDAAVIRRLSPAALELLTATSVVPDVTPELADAVLGEGAHRLIRDIDDTEGFVEIGADDTFRCHPLLRRLLVRRLRQDPARAREVARLAAQWNADRGDHDSAISIAADAGDWAWAGRQLVHTLAIPQILATGGHERLGSIEVADAVANAEPLVLAALALGRSWPEIAEPAIERAERRLGQDSEAAERLSLSLLKMAAARARAAGTAGTEHAREVLELLPALTLAQRDAAPALVPLVHSHLGLFALWNGSPERARSAFERGARGFQPKPGSSTDTAVQIATADCLGQLAFLEAIAGELNRALRHASDVLTARPADSSERGVINAQLATVWVHVARGELEQATQRFESVVVRSSGPGDGEVRPGLAAAAGLTAARLACVAGDSRLGRDVTLLNRSVAGAGWFTHQLRLTSAEAELHAGQPARALHVLGESAHASAQTHALRARAWLQLGDLSSAAAALRVRPVEPLSLVTQIQLELIEARLAYAHGDREHQRSLVDRALRTAGREQLRTPLGWAKGWLHAVVSTDHAMLRRHGSFLASIRPIRADADPDGVRGLPDSAPPSTPLTRRELDILQRLAAMSTNEEIAGQLFLSTNTIKTHLKSLYRKLDVTRRSDAVRRGRSLGLC